jgi:hypothetical protein
LIDTGLVLARRFGLDGIISLRYFVGMEATIQKPFTVGHAARRFKRTTARIRQICIEHEIGELIADRVRLLSAYDMQEIGRIIRENGYKKLS